MEGITMKLKSIIITNFGSYNTLAFEFEDLGLTLIHGATGSGKSTLLDAACWVLYGKTAKNGSVDDVRSWNNTEMCTKGSVRLVLPGKELIITRVRGTNKENDLHFTMDSDEFENEIRGKDINDTQKLINEQLGVDYDTYVASSYYCEYNLANSFFISTPKQQRELFEILSPLEMADMLSIGALNRRAEKHKILDELGKKNSAVEAKIELLKKQLDDTNKRSMEWHEKHQEHLKYLEDQSIKFSETKLQKVNELRQSRDLYDANKTKQIEHLHTKMVEVEGKLSLSVSTKCPTCGNSKDPVEWYEKELMGINVQLNALVMNINHFNSLVESNEKSENPYPELMDQERYKINPFLSQKDAIFCDLETYQLHEKDVANQVVSVIKDIEGVTQLHKLSFELRGQLISRTISSIQESVNSYLDTYFDSEFRVEFEIESADKLTTRIQKNGKPCVFRQLSKGQRNLLKLVFSLAVMKQSSMVSGVNFDTLFLDEPTDGFDDALKIKAFALLEAVSLKHGTVLVIEHSEALKSMFTRSFHITLNSDISEIIEDA